MNGLILSCPITINGNHLKITRSSIAPQELRFALLFWDRLSWPLLHGLQIHGGQDECYLKDAGILDRPIYNILGDQIQAIQLAQIEHFKVSNNKNPGMWAMGLGENSILTGEHVDKDSNGTLISLLNAIPIPTTDVPLAEILEFRQRRRAELLSFRSHVQLMLSEITGSNDSEQELLLKIKLLDKACSDLINTTKEWQFPVHLSDFKASLNFDIKKILGAGYTAFKAGNEFNLGTTTSAIMGVGAGVAGLLNISADIKFRPASLDASPYKYAYHIQNDFLL